MFAKIRFCNLCDRNVSPIKRFNWTIFLIGFLSFGIISFFYLCHFIAKGGDTCPICKNRKLQAEKPMTNA